MEAVNSLMIGGKQMTNGKNRVILIDALNMFIRSYVINPTLDAKGRPIGGAIGFMK